MIMYKDNQYSTNDTGHNRTQYTSGIVIAYSQVARVETNSTRLAEYLDLVNRGAEYILCMQSQNAGGGVVQNPHTLEDDDAFGTGQSGVALVEAYLTTGDERYRDAAIDIADWIMVNPTYPHQWPGENFRYYSNVNHHARPLWALSHIYSITGNQEYLDRSFEIAEEIIAWQNFTDTRDPFDSSLKTGTNTTWEDGGWYYYDYSPTSLPDANTDVNLGPSASFSAMRSVGYNSVTLKALVKVLEITNQHSLPGTTTERNSANFGTFKNNLITSIINGLNYHINLQEETDSGNQRRGYFSSFTDDQWQNGANLEPNTLSIGEGLPTVIEGYLALLRAQALNTQDITRLETLINSLADHMESGGRNTTGWGLSEWYTDQMTLSWSRYIEYLNEVPFDDNLTLLNNGFEGDEITW